MSNGIVIKIGGGGGAGVDDTARAAITALQNQKGAANGIATLNEDRKLSSDQVPDNVVTTGQDGKIPLEKLPEGLGGDGGVDIEARQAIATLQTDKADKSQVLTNVPEDAVFTDTVTRINNKTGDITKEDIMALGIPGQDTVTTVNGKTGPITKADIVALGIPSQDTDTVTTINGKTGAITKADIVALGIPAQDTVTTVNGKTGAITKADIVALGIPASDLQNLIGEPEGIAALDEDGKVPLEQLPEDIGSGGVDTEARASIAQLESQINDVMTYENQVWEV